MFDILIKNGRVIDGTGSPWFQADVGLVGGRIARVGDLRGCQAHLVLDAADQVVSPGFIDAHSHSELRLFQEPELHAKLEQGITTEVTGNCGVGAAPVSDRFKDEWIDYARLTIGESTASWNWSSFGEFLDRLQEAGPSPNVAVLATHCTIRAAVMGLENRTATEEEIVQMEALLDRDFRDGAWGLSTGFVYVPAVYADEAEYVRLARVAAAHRTYFSAHVRNQGDECVESILETLAIARKAGVSVQIAHHKCKGKRNKGRVAITLSLLDDARLNGLETTSDQYPYPAGGGKMAAVFPAWVQEGRPEDMTLRLQTPGARERLHQEIAKGIPGWENRPKTVGWHNIFVVSVDKPHNRQLVGKSVAFLAETRQTNPLDALIDLMIDETCRVGQIHFSQDESDLRQVMVHPSTMIGTDGLYSGGKAHPRLYGSFPRVLGKYVREEGVLTLEEAIRKMTSLPAQRVGLFDRGVIREGLAADVTVFDPGTVLDTATFDDPVRRPIGISYVIVNGALTVKDGAHTGAQNGKVLRRQSR